MAKKITVTLFSLLFLGGCVSPTDTDFSSRQDLSEYTSAWALLKAYYFYQDEVPSDPFEHTSAESLYLQTSDPWTMYISPDMADYFLSFFSTENASGIGVFISTRFDSVYYIHHVIPNTPADRAGILKGDTLVRVNGVRTNAISFDSLYTLMTGPEGTSVRLDLARSSGPRTVTVVRAPFTAPTAFTDLMENNIPYIALLEFFDSTMAGGGGTSDELYTLLRQTDAYATLPAILDLRGNPGGLIDQCMDCASQFLPQNTVIIRSKYKHMDPSSGTGLILDTVYTASSGARDVNRTLIILTDGNTASAAEILSAALQDNGTNVFVMGSPTYGKARGQILASTMSGGVARVTNMTFTTSNNVDYNLTGLAPDSLLGPDVDWLDYAWRRASLMAGLPVPKAYLAGSRGLSSKAAEIDFNRKLLGFKGSPRFRNSPKTTLP